MRQIWTAGLLDHYVPLVHYNELASGVVAFTTTGAQDFLLSSARSILASADRVKNDVTVSRLCISATAPFPNAPMMVPTRALFARLTARAIAIA